MKAHRVSPTTGDVPPLTAAGSEAAAVLAQRAPAPPRVGIVLGSGLGAVAEAVEEAVTIPYKELPGFPRPTVAGHAGSAVVQPSAGANGSLPERTANVSLHVLRQ